MKSENAKTILGLILIAIIVVATFLYGNSQRQAQLRAQDDANRQKLAQTTPSVSAPASTPAGVGTTTHNTAPVTSPTANSIQGGATVATGTAATTVRPTTVPSPVVANIPDTGASTSALLGISLLLVAMAYWQASRRLLAVSLRTPRN